MLDFHHVCAGYGQAAILQDISFSVPSGSITTLIGPNGCGKTTLLRAGARQLPLLGGEILLDGKPLHAYSRNSLAQTAAFLPQVRTVPSITVGALVAHGRFPYLGFSRQLRPCDRAAIQKAMEDTGTTAWAQRNLQTLSGGERQRVFLAMALAQSTPLIFLDEPTTYLDLGRQFELLELISQLQQQGKTVVMVLHDLAQALQYSHQILLLDRGRVRACAPPKALYESGALEEVFGVRAHRSDGVYYFTPAKP